MRSGLARYEFRHFIIFGAQSEFAAMATECAGDQGAWWEFHDAYLLEAQARTYTRSGAIELARDEGLNVTRFTQCIDDEEHAERILQMQQQGARGWGQRHADVPHQRSARRALAGRPDRSGVCGGGGGRA